MVDTVFMILHCKYALNKTEAKFNREAENEGK